MIGSWRVENFGWGGFVDWVYVLVRGVSVRNADCSV